MLKIFRVFLIYLLVFNPAYSVNITGDDNEINSDSTTQQVYNADDTSLTITNSSTLSRTGQAPVNINGQDNGTLTINSGSSITATSHNTVQGRNQDGLTVTNSGTISSGGSKAINLLNAQNSTVTNNSGGIIKSNTNTVTLTEDGGTGNNVTITNSGQIFAEAVSSGTTNNNAVKSEDDTNNMTLTNNAGGHIYNNNSSATALQQATVFIAAEDTATLTNSGKIENKAGPENFAIGIAGSGVTVTLKDAGIVIGKINVADSGHTIRLQHGAGQGYYYDITGNGTYTLQDLDGNPVVKGSAGSVGQGGNEMVDEELGYKSLSMRNSFARYQQSDEYSERANGWGEITTSFFKRDGDKNTLALDNEKIGIGANIFEPISNNKTLIFSFETSIQNISKNHDIDKFSFLTGINFDKIEISDGINSEIYLLGGASFNKSDRNILTNTTSSGLLDISDEYSSYEALIGNKIIFNNLLPDLSFNFGYSHIPSHEESKYYKWEERDVYNGSIALSNEHQILKDNKKSLYLSWIADARTILNDDLQVFYVNGTKGTYTQNNDLKTEFSLSAGINYDYKFSQNSKFSVALDGLHTTQDTNSIKANLKYSHKF